jgi:hypothetical protein
MNGEVVARTMDERGARTLELRERIAVDRHSWIAARCGGSEYFEPLRHHDLRERGIFAHTSPMYVGVGGAWTMFDAERARPLLQVLHGGIRHIREQAAHWPADRVTHPHGRTDHLEYLEQPFLEAIDRLEARLHEEA